MGMSFAFFPLFVNLLANIIDQPTDGDTGDKRIYVDMATALGYPENLLKDTIINQMFFSSILGPRRKWQNKMIHHILVKYGFSAITVLAVGSRAW